ncbi:histone-like nucleoid-structuring protein Lsr2 [Mycolicibacterium neoaurum]|uniref:histone-like nucleoid-structuring protein Lsr2 n=1 Tax=Mycolicibacterium neoaurum TaxID=1795 RepID=UPI001F4C8BA9|nr:Lsr2 family protein [Mycolicibacterium neoaurum]
MAKTTEIIRKVTVIDDFDGNEIEDGLAETFEFSFEGSDYILDLRPANATKFRKDLEKWVAASSKVTGKRGRPRGASTASKRPGTGSGRSKEELQAARDWLTKNGHEVAPRGRIKAELLEIFDQAHAS